MASVLFIAAALCGHLEALAHPVFAVMPATTGSAQEGDGPGDGVNRCCAQCGTRRTGLRATGDAIVVADASTVARSRQSPVRTITVRGKVFDLEAPLPLPPRTLPDGHPLLRPSAIDDDGEALGGRLAPGFDTPERRAIHQKIVDETFAGVTPQAAPVLFVMAGGGGSGKGFVRARLEATGEIPTRNRVLLDPDAVKEKLPEWRPFKDAGDGRAAATLHRESSMLTKHMRAQAARRRVDVVLDVTLSDAADARRIFDQFRRAGYQIRLFGVATDVQVAAAQAGDRAQLSNRWVPWEELLSAHRDLAEAFEGYAPQVDHMSLFDNNGDDPILIAERDATGRLVIVDPPRYKRWRDRGSRIDPAARTLGEIYGRTSQ